MNAIFTRPLRRTKHILTAEWRAEMERLQATCRHPRVRPTVRQSHQWICDDCNAALYKALEASMLHDRAPLPILEAEIDRLERIVAA